MSEKFIIEDCYKRFMEYFLWVRYKGIEGIVIWGRRDKIFT